MEETKLVQAALEGDEAAFEALVKKYYRKVYQLAVSITNNPAEAEDLAQEVFIKVYSSLSQFQGQSSFGTWLYQVT
ncbi:MAG TPA: sigma-70 family RNA polymerase sigma factor, partial [Candidatus Aminicenantes bacterium]|nr:sigma-70 family RNA polymerase sigma factor [Candidatus Aminicenantes bacterium]